MIRIVSHFGFLLIGAALVACPGCAPTDSSAPESGRTSSDVSLRCGDELQPNARDVSFHLSQTRAGDGPFEIVTTVGMVTDIVRHVAGNRARVTGLMSEGVDPHLYQATRNDVQKLIEADVVFYSGLNLEHRMQDVFDRQAKTGKAIFAVTDGLSRGFLHTPPEFEGYPDPHVWGNIAAWSLCTGHVAQALAAYDPQGKDVYAKNAEAYRKQLAELADYATKAIASIPEENRVLITAHDAFGYFSCAYKIPVKSAQGITTESEAGVNDVNRLVDVIVARKIKAIFVESSVNPKNMQAIREGAKKRGQDVAIGGKLYSDAMGRTGTYEGTYIGMMDHNITTITLALGGEAPKRGLYGKLSGE